MRKYLVSIIAVCMFMPGTLLQAQNAVAVSGGNATGSGGTVSYTVGQVVYTTNMSITYGSVAPGVQQPYEISVVTEIANTKGINLVSKVYPNPTDGLLKLIVESFDQENLRFRLYDINGVLLQNKKVESRETEISMANLSSSIYFLKIINNNLEVKVFKIVKR